MHERRTRFYLDKQRGKFMGVCAGVAEYTGIDLTWVRVGAVLTTIFVFQPLIVVYLVTGWVAPAKPRDLYLDAEEAKFWQGARGNARRSVGELSSRFRDVDRRLADVELMVTSRNSRLADEIEALR